MQRLGVVVIQLQEARRLLLKNRPEYHRIALVLLDNAAELQLMRAMQWHVHHDEIMEQIRGIDTASEPDATSLPGQTLAPIKERKAKLERYFDEKLQYLSAEKGRIEPQLAEVLRYLHDSRNRAYHHGEVQDRIAKSLASLLLDLNCRLLETLPVSMVAWLSSGDYSWLEEGFGVDPWHFDWKTDMKRITSSLRSGVPLAVSNIRDPLVAECQVRLQRLQHALDYIVENDKWATDQASALKLAQYYTHLESTDEYRTEHGFARFRPPYGVRRLQKCQSRIEALASADTPVLAFERFARLSDALEAIEADVYGLAREIEAFIQDELDRMLGK